MHLDQKEKKEKAYALSARGGDTERESEDAAGFERSEGVDAVSAREVFNFVMMMMSGSEYVPSNIKLIEHGFYEK